MQSVVVANAVPGERAPASIVARVAGSGVVATAIASLAARRASCLREDAAGLN